MSFGLHTLTCQIIVQQILLIFGEKNTYTTLLGTVPLSDWLEKKKAPAIIIKQQFGFPMSTSLILSFIKFYQELFE